MLLGAILCAPVAAQPNPAQTLTFDGDVGPGNPDITGLEISPWLFASQKFHSVSIPNAGLVPLTDNGTPYLASVGGGLDYPITLERTDGAPFAISGFDVSECFLDDLLAGEQGFIGATKVEIEAALSSGFTVTLEFDLDNLRDGPQGADDFQTITLPDELQSVLSVTFTGLAGNRRDAGFAIDNVVVASTVVPEPAAISLAITAGIAALVAYRRRRSLHN